MNIFPKKLEASHVLFLVIGFALAMLVNKPKVIEGGKCTSSSSSANEDEVY